MSGAETLLQVDADGNTQLPVHRRGGGEHEDGATDAPPSTATLRLPSRDENVHLQNFIQKTQAFRGERLFGYVDAVYSIAATVMVVPTVSTSSTITSNTSYYQAAQVILGG